MAASTGTVLSGDFLDQEYHETVVLVVVVGLVLLFLLFSLPLWGGIDDPKQPRKQLLVLLG